MSTHTHTEQWNTGCNLNFLPWCFKCTSGFFGFWISLYGGLHMQSARQTDGKNQTYLPNVPKTHSFFLTVKVIILYRFYDVTRFILMEAWKSYPLTGAVHHTLVCTYITDVREAISSLQRGWGICPAAAGVWPLANLLTAPSQNINTAAVFQSWQCSIISSPHVAFIIMPTFTVFQLESSSLARQPF